MSRNSNSDSSIFQKAPATPPSTPVNDSTIDQDLNFSEPSLLDLSDSAPPESLSVNHPTTQPTVNNQPQSPLSGLHVLNVKSDIEQSSSSANSLHSRSSITSTRTSIESEIYEKEFSAQTQSAQTPIEQNLSNKLISAIESGSHDSVLSAFHQFRSKNLTPSLTSYEKTLSFLSSTILSHDSSTNLTNILSIYTDAVSKRIALSSSIYTSVITGLVSLASHTAQHKENNLSYFRLSNRHGNDILPSVKTSAQKGDSSVSLYKAALDVFEASNVVKTQKFSLDIYQSVLDACIATENYALIYRVTKMLEVNNCVLTADTFVSLIKGYGKHGDVKAAVETYKHYKLLSGNMVNKKEFEIYAALIGAYFDSGKPSHGLVFLNKILDSNSDSEDIGVVLSEVVAGFGRIGDYESALTWVKRVESDEKLASLDLQTLVGVFSACADFSDIETCRSLFDFIASRIDAQEPAFNVSRNDYLAVCVKAADTNSLFKAIKETHIREGVWELSTLLSVTKYLLHIGDVEFALRTFGIQSQRYLDHMSMSNLQLEEQNVDAINYISLELIKRNLLTPRASLSLIKSAFFDSRVFSDVNGGGIACVEALWNAQSNGSISSILTETPFAIVDIVNAHLKWIHASAANNSLGSLSIPTPLLNNLRSNFAGFVQRLMAISPALDENFKAEISNALEILDDTVCLSEWTSHCEALQKPALSESFESFESKPVAFHDSRATNRIIIASQHTNTLNDAAEMLQAAVTAGENIGADAYTSIIDAASITKNGSLIKQVYKIALTGLPHPSTNSYSFTAWVQVHRSVVRTANVNFEVAQAAYKHLIGLGMFPDATGYGQLISNVPVSDNHDEAGDALWMFHEAQVNQVPLNTFLYNVVLSKLSKARRLNDVIAYFNDMDATNTKKSSVTYGTVISACCRCCDEAAAKTYFDEMEASPYYAPKIAPFNIMLQFYVHNKRDRKSALEIYSRLRNLGLKPSAHTYKLLIDAHSMIEPIDIDAADNVLLSIISDKSVVTTKHYSSLLYARGVSMKNQIAAQEFYNALVLNNRVRPDKHIFQALLETYVVNKSVRSTPGVLKDMISYGVDLDAYMANILIRGWAPVSLDKSAGLFAHILEAGITEPSSFESIIRAYLYYGDVASAQGVLNVMASHFYPAPVVAKIQNFIAAHSTPATKVTEDMLLESIFRHDSQALSGLVFKDSQQAVNRQQQQQQQEENGSLLEAFDTRPSVSSPPKLVGY